MTMKIERVRIVVGVVYAGRNRIGLQVTGRRIHAKLFFVPLSTNFLARIRAGPCNQSARNRLFVPGGLSDPDYEVVKVGGNGPKDCLTNRLQSQRLIAHGS